MKLTEITEAPMTQEELIKELGIPKTAFKMSKTDEITINWPKAKSVAVMLTSKMVTDGQLNIKFNEVILGGGSFGISTRQNLNLINLRGMPKKFNGLGDGTFNITDSDTLQTLRGGPSEFRGNYQISNCSKLQALRGLPLILNGNLSIENVPITEFDHMPNTFIGSLTLKNLKNLTSFIGIEEQLKNFKGKIFSNFLDVKQGGLGLILIPGLTDIKPYSDFGGNAKMLGPFKIIRKYIGQSDKIFECQEELIEAGFEEYAQL